MTSSPTITWKKENGRKAIKAKRSSPSTVSESLPLTSSVTSPKVTNASNEFPDGCRVLLHSLPEYSGEYILSQFSEEYLLSKFNGKCARVTSGDNVAVSGFYTCEVGVDGHIENKHVRPQNLRRLPGLPSNCSMLQAHTPPCMEDALRGRACGWRVGGLVALVPVDKKGTAQSISLVDGGGLQLLGCVKSVDLENKQMEVLVSQGNELLLSQTLPEIGQVVCLSMRYATVQDARLGPLNPGDTGKILTIEGNNLFLVQKNGDDSKWWYSIDALAVASSNTFTFPLQHFPYLAGSLETELNKVKPNKSYERPVVGSQVKLTANYEKFGNASKGSLQPGVIGQLLKDDKDHTPFKVEAPNGQIFWYKEGAIEPANIHNLTGTPVEALIRSTPFVKKIDFHHLRTICSEDVDSLPKIDVLPSWKAWSSLESPCKADNVAPNPQQNDYGVCGNLNANELSKLKVDEPVPSTWTEGRQYHIDKKDRFEVDEICVIKRSDGKALIHTQ